MQILNRAAILFLFFYFQSFSQQASPFAERFIADLVNNNNIEKYILPAELDASNRLGITYDSVSYKFLIAYDIDEKVKAAIKKGFKDYKVNREVLSNGYSRISFSLPAQNYTRQYYFKDSFLVSPPYYHSKDWHKAGSKYFIFYLSDKSLFNDYCMRRLDNFIEETAAKLGYNDEELKNLGTNKIIYFLCRDEKEVEQLTGYQARGNYILAYDYIVTTYNCHYHEIVHLLINNKLKKLPLYTHPFFQEGIAVALGGRGGFEPDVVSELGRFLCNSGFVNYKELLNYKDYFSMDASMAYPVSGLYNSFLIEYLGIKKYFEAYKKYSGSFESISQSIVDKKDIPAEEEVNNFIKAETGNKIQLFVAPDDLTSIYKNDFCNVSVNDSLYFFEVKDYILISPENYPKEYLSKKFSEEFPSGKYNGEKYLLRVNESEISLYNLYTNNLIAKYSTGFSLEMKPVVKRNGYFSFAIPKNCFDEDLTNAVFTR